MDFEEEEEGRNMGHWHLTTAVVSIRGTSWTALHKLPEQKHRTVGKCGRKPKICRSTQATRVHTNLDRAKSTSLDGVIKSYTVKKIKEDSPLY